MFLLLGEVSGETLQRYVEKFWDACLKATVYIKINFNEQRQQFCAGLPKDMRTYVQALRPRTIAEVIHHTAIAYKIFKPKNAIKDGKVAALPNVKFNGNPNAKNNAKKRGSNGSFKGNNRLSSSEELEKYRKENCCF